CNRNAARPPTRNCRPRASTPRKRRFQMATRNGKPRSTGRKASKAVATDSGPARRKRKPQDAGEQLAADVDAVAAALPTNLLKVGEYGEENGRTPLAGAMVDVPPRSGASSLSEANMSAK